MLRFNFPSIPKILISILVIVLICMGVLYLKKIYSSSSDKKESTLVKVLPEFLTQLKESWVNPDNKYLKNTIFKKCQLFKDYEYSDEFLSCNSLYLDCFFNEQEKANFSDYKFKNHQFIPQKLRSNTYIEDHPRDIRILFLDKLTKKTFKVSLQKSCKGKLLPKSIYSAGPSRDTSYVWDNLNYDIFIDRDYVSRFDIWNWAKKTSNIKLELEFDKESEFNKPVLKLPRVKQIAYCHAQGKQILESRYFDAATFYPSSAQLNYKYPFHWTKNNETFLTNSKKLKKSNCSDVMVAECGKFYSQDALPHSGLSWIGLYHSLGGQAESFRNIFERDANLKISSSFLSRSSGWHRLGLRASWDGRGFNTRNYKFFDQYSGRYIEHKPSLKGVAFRCMEMR